MAPPILMKKKDFYCYLKLAYFMVLSMMFMKVINPDPDSYFLAATGRYIYEHKTVPSINPFTIHEGIGTIIQQWIPDLINYFLHSNFGPMGLHLYGIGFYLCALGLLYVYFSLFSNNKYLKIDLLCISSLILICFSNTRPTTITFLVLLTELIFLEKYKRKRDIKYLLILPVLSLIEINCHAAMWEMMFILLLPYIAGDIFQKKVDLKLIGSIIPIFLVGFINPNGIKGMLYIYYSYGPASTAVQIQEMMPPAFKSFFGLFIIVAIAFFSIYIYKNIRLKEHNFDSTFFLALGTIIMACINKRSLWFLLFSIPPIVLTMVYPVDKECKILTKKETISLTVLHAILIVAIINCIFPNVNYKIEDSDLMPMEAVEYLEEVDNPVLFNEFNSGAYLEWKGFKTYLDARPEIYSSKITGSEDIITEYSEVVNGCIDYQEFINKYNFTYLLVTKDSKFDIYLRDHNYNSVVSTDSYVLYEK